MARFGHLSKVVRSGFRRGTGATWKLTQGNGNLDSLLNQFGKPIAGDKTARPLLVTEGSAADKLSAIEDNLYLSHARERLAQRPEPLVVFICKNCGYVMQFAERPGGPQASYTQVGGDQAPS